MRLRIPSALRTAMTQVRHSAASKFATTLPASPNISDQKLGAAAAALARVASIKRNYQRQMATAAPSDKDRIAGDASNVMKKAVTDQGLSVDEYTSILRGAQNDPRVREKLLQGLPSPAQ
jgi:hypothetical protein